MSTTDSTIGLIGYLGVIALVVLGIMLMLRGPGGRSVTIGAPAGFGQGAFGRTVASLLAFAVAYKFFFEAYTDRLYSFEAMITLAGFALFAMVLLPFVEILVSVAALTVFLINNTAAFGQAALGTFIGLLVVFGLLRWFLGR